MTARIFRRGTIALALLAAGFGMLAPGGATPAPASRSDRTADIRADYTVYVGGLIFAEGSMKATLSGDGYLLENELGSAGLPRRFWEAKWTMTSEGHIANDRVHPSRFAFTATEKNETKRRLIVYDTNGTPELTFDPPLPPDEHEETPPLSERKKTLDPVSAFLLPVIGDGNPCDRTLPVFDGKRRYDLQLTYDGDDKVTTRDNGYSGKAVRCKVRVMPRAGMQRAKLATSLRQRGDTLIWLAPVRDDQLYIPVRVQLRTPIGAAILDVVKLQRYAEGAEEAEKTVE
ncbi:MAG: DUF3108 domain-containing protein [Parvibaculum sp.]